MDWPFDGILTAPPAFAPGFCVISPHLPVIPAKTRLTFSTAPPVLSDHPPVVSDTALTASEVITLCSRTFSPEVEQMLLRSPEARDMKAQQVFSTATVKQYSAHEIVIELGHDFL